ncbi:Hypothetical protein D9617_6g093250 [Elsinoe fawcettii]|nr:Hypothetical protein D9617_6g093250 [Elsinoe fawcettii]
MGIDPAHRESLEAVRTILRHNQVRLKAILWTIQDTARQFGTVDPSKVGHETTTILDEKIREDGSAVVEPKSKKAIGLLGLCYERIEAFLEDGIGRRKLDETAKQLDRFRLEAYRFDQVCLVAEASYELYQELGGKDEFVRPSKRYKK